MASDAEILSRLSVLENKIASAQTLPLGSVDINETKVSDKTGWLVYGTKAGIHSGKLFVGIALVANPTQDSNITFIHKAI